MKNPREIVTVKEGAEYVVPTYFIDENGLQDGEGVQVKFCKGSKEDESIFRQEGVITESLIQLCRQSIVDLNTNDLFDKHNELIIAHMDAALLAVKARQDDRKARGVQATYKK